MGRRVLLFGWLLYAMGMLLPPQSEAARRPAAPAMQRMPHRSLVMQVNAYLQPHRFFVLAQGETWEVKPPEGYAIDNAGVSRLGQLAAVMTNATTGQGGLWVRSRFGVWEQWAADQDISSLSFLNENKLVGVQAGTLVMIARPRPRRLSRPVTLYAGDYAIGVAAAHYSGKIAFTEGVGRSHRICVMEASGELVSELPWRTDCSTLTGLDWSADGSSLLHVELYRLPNWACAKAGDPTVDYGEELTVLDSLPYAWYLPDGGFAFVVPDPEDPTYTGSELIFRPATGTASHLDVPQGTVVQLWAF